MSRGIDADIVCTTNLSILRVSYPTLGGAEDEARGGGGTAAQRFSAPQT